MIERAVQRLRALADSTRIRIMMKLRDEEANVSTLATELELNQPTVSKHLAVLKQAGMIQMRPHGAQSFYSIKDATVFSICDIVCSSIRRDLAETTSALGITKEVPGVENGNQAD